MCKLSKLDIGLNNLFCIFFYACVKDFPDPVMRLTFHNDRHTLEYFGAVTELPFPVPPPARACTQCGQSSTRAAHASMHLCCYHATKTLNTL